MFLKIIFNQDPIGSGESSLGPRWSSLKIQNDIVMSTTKWDFTAADALFESSGQRRDEILGSKATGRANTDRTGQSYQVCGWSVRDEK